MALSFDNLTVHTQTGGGTWIDYGGGGGSAANTDVFISSTGSRARKVSNGIKGFAYDLGAGGTDLTNTVVVVRWATLAGVGALNTRASGGVRLRLEDTSGNQSDYYVDGNDSYTGGWKVSAVSTAKTASATSGTLSITAVRYIGIVWDETASVGGGDSNCFIDEILSFPDAGLNVSGTSSAVIADLQAEDDTGDYGIFETRSGQTFCKGLINLQPTSAVTSTGETLVFEDPVYYQGTATHSTLVNAGIKKTTSVGLTINRGTLIAYDDTGATTNEAARQLDLSGSSVDVNVATFVGFDDAVSLGASTNTFDDVTFNGCAKVTDTGAVVRGAIFRNAVDATGAYTWTTSTDMQDSTFVSDGTGHGIDMASAPTDPSVTSFVGIVATGYGANDTANATVDNNTAHDVLIGASGGTSGITVNPTSSTTYANTVTVKVTVQDAATLAAVEGARVLVEADAGGPLPAGDAVTIASSTTTATVTHTAHGLSTGAVVIIRGCTEDEYNGAFAVTVTGANTYTYTMASDPAGSAATGSPTATARILTGTSDSSGIVSDAGFNFQSNQPVIGKARKASAAPYYKTTLIVGTITSAGLDQTIVAVRDE